MTANNGHDIAPIDPDDIGHNNTANPSFNDLIAARLSRRHLFGLGVGTRRRRAAAGLRRRRQTTPAAAAGARRRHPPRTRAGPGAGRTQARLHAPCAKSLDDVVTVPPGYTATVLYRLGDPIAAGVAGLRERRHRRARDLRPQRAGDHHDGMHLLRPRRRRTSGTRRDADARPAGDEPRGHHAAVPAPERPDHRRHGACAPSPTRCSASSTCTA